MVGMAGFEPTTFRSQSGRATNLRHIPSSQTLAAKLIGDQDGSLTAYSA
jgi:hypothetical protein